MFIKVGEKEMIGKGPKILLVELIEIGMRKMIICMFGH